jgi:autotransporter-associated beta strand protein
MKMIKLAKSYPLAAGVLAQAVLALMLATTPAGATDGFWVGKGAQAFGQAIWGGVANWNPSGQIANLAGGTAYFTNTFVNGYNVFYNVTRTIGNVWFTDPADANDFFILDQQLVMTLQGSTATVYPTINVTQPDRTLTIQCVIAGTNGLAKIGAGTLVLTNANTYTGLTVVSNGTLKLASALYAATAVFVNGGATNVVLVNANNNGQLTIPGAWTKADSSVQIIDYGTTTPTTTVAPLSVTNWVLGANLSLQIIGGPFLNGRSYPLVTWPAAPARPMPQFFPMRLPP